MTVSQTKRLNKNKSLKKDLAPVYYTPEQLSEYYDKLIGAGYMTKEQADQALEQVIAQI